MIACADPLDPTTAVALLAAGRGERFAGDKLGGDLGGRPLWRHAADAADRAGFRTRILIASAANVTTFEAAPWDVAVNSRAGEGMGTSVACAAQAAGHCKRLVLILADMPFVEPEHLRALALGEGVSFTHYPDHSRGIPAAFPASALARLAKLKGDRGASVKAWSGEASPLPPLSPDSLFDIDTHEDLVLARERFAAGL